MFAIRPVALALVAAVSVPAGAVDTPATMTCRPELPVFCRNVHVGCAGRTAIPARPFTLSLRAATATILFAGQPAPVTGVVTGGGDRVIRLDVGRDWIRLEPDGRFSHRIYRRAGAAMSFGVCRTTADPRS